MQELEVIKTHQLAKIELDMQVSTAKAYPRDYQKSLDKAKKVCTSSKEVALACAYTLDWITDKKTKKPLVGRSIRLAEAILSAWGNVHAATRVLGNDGRMVSAEAVVWDLENNVRLSVEVKRSILDSHGKMLKNEGIVNASHAASSIALRNIVFKLVPHSFIDEVYLAARTLALSDLDSTGKEKTFEQKASELLTRLEQRYAIKPERILGYLYKNSINELTEDDLLIIKGVATELFAATILAENAFTHEVVNNKSATEELKEAANAETVIAETQSTQEWLDDNK